LLIIVPFIFERTRVIAPFVLAAICITMIFTDAKKMHAAIVFLCAGAVGYFGFIYLNQPFLVLLSGLFGTPFILGGTNLTSNQTIENTSTSNKTMILGGTMAFISAFFLTFIPAVGPGQASVFTRRFLKGDRAFLFSLGALSGLDVIFSVVLLHSVGKSRIGLLEMTSQLFTWNMETLLMMLGAIIICAVLSFFAVMWIGKKLVNIQEKIKIKHVGIIVMGFIIASVIYFDRGWGLFFLEISSAIGIYNNRSGAAMSNSMGALIVPTLLNYII
jgi:TctA family transporter